MNKQNRNRLINTENILMVARWEGVAGMGEKGKGAEKYKLVVTKQSSLLCMVSDGCDLLR